MKRAIFTLICLICLQLTSFSQAEIKIHIKDAQYDSIHIQKFEKEYTDIYVQKGSDNIVFKSKQSLVPGLYLIVGDKTNIGSFIISNNDNQNFSIEINEENPVFTNSDDNTQYINYLKQLHQYDKRLDSLQQIYNQAAVSMPQYMLAPLVEQLTEQAKSINQEKIDYQKSVGRDLHGTLTGSIARATTQIPSPPDEQNQDPARIQQYVLDNFFNDFPWEDTRVLNTPYAHSRIQEFVSLLVRWKRPEYTPYVIKVLQAAKVDTSSYFYLFDQLEEILGDHASPVRIEPIYIQMLKDMQTLPKLPEFRARHCKYELSQIDINNEGDIAPNFKIVTNTGDTTTLHDIQSEYLLLYLQHPTCPTCQKVRKMIADYPVLNNAIASGKLKVLMVYFEDEADVWNNYINSPEANPSYLHGWNFDQSIEQKNLYDTRAIPYMFLLDKDKRIIKKNVMETELENEIRKLYINY